MRQSGLNEEGTGGNIQIDISIHQDAILLKGDRQELTHLFYYLVQNAIEAAGTDNPRIAIISELNQILPIMSESKFSIQASLPKRRWSISFLHSIQQNSRGLGLGFPSLRSL